MFFLCHSTSSYIIYGVKCCDTWVNSLIKKEKCWRIRYLFSPPYSLLFFAWWWLIKLYICFSKHIQHIIGKYTSFFGNAAWSIFLLLYFASSSPLISPPSLALPFRSVRPLSPRRLRSDPTKEHFYTKSATAIWDCKCELAFQKIFYSFFSRFYAS